MHGRMFTYIYHKDQPNVGIYIYIPYMDPLLYELNFCSFPFTKSVCRISSRHPKRLVVPNQLTRSLLVAGAQSQLLI